MRESKVSSRYAKSLMDMAIANNTLNQVKTDIEFVLKTIDDSRELQNMFDSPIINSGNKTIVAGKIFEKNVSKETYNFMQLVIAKKREMLLLSIAYQFMDQYNAMHGIVDAKVTTAQPLSDAVKIEIQADLEKKLNKKLIITYQTNPEIIGGIVIHFSDKLYDASIAHQLQLVKQELIQSYISKN